MKEVENIYTLLLHNAGLKIKDIAKDLDYDKYHVADIMFSVENINYWYQDSTSKWYAKEGALQIEVPEEHKDPLTAPVEKTQTYNISKFLSGGSSDSLRFYLCQVSQFRLYSNEEIAELFRRYRDGDETAYDLIVKSQQRLVVNLAYLYHHKGALLEDLIQEGNLGLTRAIESFNGEQFYSFSNYAKSWIMQALSNAMMYLPYLVRLPLNQISSYRKVQRFKEQYEQKYGHGPAVTDIEIDTNDNLNKLSYLNNLPSSPNEIVEFHEDMDYLESRYTFADNFENNNYNHYYLNKLLSFLPRRSKEIVEAYYGLGDYRGQENTLETVGDKFGLTRERCRQVVEKARREMREQAKVVVRNPFRLELTPGINRFVPEPEFRVIAEKEKNQEISEIKESSPENAPEKKKRGRPLKIKNATETKGQKNAAVNAARDKEPDVTTIVDGKYGIGISSNKGYIYDVATHKKLYESRGKIVYIRQHFYRLYYAYSSIVIHQIRVSPNNSFSTGDLVLYAGMKTQIHGRLNKTNYDKQVQDIKIDARTLDYLIKVNGDWYDSKGLQIKQ